jgi:hypothetical protein
MILYAISHPIDTTVHALPAGFRWAVSTSDDPSDVTACLGAGWVADSGAAAWIADQAAAIGAQANRMAAGTCEVVNLALNYDPIPADSDSIGLGV